MSDKKNKKDKSIKVSGVEGKFTAPVVEVSRDNLNNVAIAEEITSDVTKITAELLSKTEEYNLHYGQLFDKLDSIGVKLEDTARIYTTIKLMHMSLTAMINEDIPKEDLFNKVFSGNLVFIQQFRDVYKDIPMDKVNDVTVIVTNILYQMETENAQREVTDEGDGTVSAI